MYCIYVEISGQDGKNAINQYKRVKSETYVCIQLTLARNKNIPLQLTFD